MARSLGAFPQEVCLRAALVGSRRHRRRARDAAVESVQVTDPIAELVVQRADLVIGTVHRCYL